jgi:hypothetical protein
LEKSETGNSKYGAILLQCFTLEQVKEINKEIKKNIMGKEPLVYSADDASKTGTFTHVHCGSLIELIHPWLYRCQLVNKSTFGYNVDWDFHLDILHYNVYGIGGKYGWHIDAGIKNAEEGSVTVSDMKLTCLLNLSEETYEGGEFYTINDNKEHKFTSGMGLIMNSLIAHQVTPVTKGERITLTYWGQGPAWR